MTTSPPDRRLPPGSPPFRVLLELPERWSTYIAYDDPTCFEDDDPDDPWGQAAADREIATLEAESYRLTGPADDPNEKEFARYNGLHGP